MGLFVTSKSQRRHGTYVIRSKGTKNFTPKGTGVAAIVAQFPWGPVGTLITTPGTKERADMFCPAGMDHLSTGYLAITNKAWPTLKVVRAASSTAATATCLLTDASSTIVTVTAKYPGAAINTVGTCVVSDASDGNANHFNLLVSITGASGQSFDQFANIDATGTTITITNSTADSWILVGSFTVTNAGRPANGTYTFSGGTSPAVVSGDYVGTAGTGDKGLAALESDASINHVFVDDCGASLRAAVNAGVQAHINRMGDRIGYINGNSGQSAANVLTDKANYTSPFLVYLDPWVYVRDDVVGDLHLVPSAPFAASVASQLVTTTAISWKAAEVRAMLDGIVGVEYVRGDATGDNTDSGICTVIQEGSGGFTFEADVTCAKPIDGTYLTMIRFEILIAKTFVENTREYVDAPLVGPVTQPIIDALETLMKAFKANSQNSDAVHLDQCKDYRIEDVAAENSQQDLDSGRFTIPLAVKESSSLRWLFLKLRAGEGIVL